MGAPRPPHAGRAEFMIDQLQLFLEELSRLPDEASAVKAEFSVGNNLVPI